MKKNSDELNNIEQIIDEISRVIWQNRLRWNKNINFIVIQKSLENKNTK